MVAATQSIPRDIYRDRQFRRRVRKDDTVGFIRRPDDRAECMVLIQDIWIPSVVMSSRGFARLLAKNSRPSSS